MKIKRFLAPDIRQALQQVKETLGADAVILSNRKTEQGVEIIATCDFDLETVAAKPPPKSSPARPEPPESLKPTSPKPAFSARGYRAVAEFTGAQARQASEKPTAEAERQAPDALASLRYELQEMRRLLDRHLTREPANSLALELLRTLQELGFSAKLASELAKQVDAREDFPSALFKVRKRLSERVVSCEPQLENGGIAALVGPTGVGKTTTIAKLAARFRLEHGPRQVALVTTDNYRIAAYEQLATYARILGVPIRAAANFAELRAAVQSFKDRRLILIDTAGMSPKDLRLAEQLALLRTGEVPISTYLVLAAGAQLSCLTEAIEAFSSCHPKAVILTKLDEAGSLGAALSALIQAGLPAAFVTDGQQVPEDLHTVRTEALIERCFEALPLYSPTERFELEDWAAHV
jgi:flagellar biosynthesis protein FlhF